MKKKNNKKTISYKDFMNLIKDKKNNIPNSEMQSIPLDFLKKVINEVSKSVCKITIESMNQKFYGTGFFMMIQSDEGKNISCMLTNFHVISEDIIKYKNAIIKIEIDSENEKNSKMVQQIEFGNDDRFILFLQKPIDITVIEILDSDIIKDKIKFLPCDLDCKKDRYKKYINKEVFILHHPEGRNTEYAFGKIISFKNFKLEHNISTKKGSSGSAIILKETFEVIGIHRGKIYWNNIPHNEGTFIGILIESIKKRPQNKLKISSIEYSINDDNEDIDINYKDLDFTTPTTPFDFEETTKGNSLTKEEKKTIKETNDETITPFEEKGNKGNIEINIKNNNIIKESKKESKDKNKSNNIITIRYKNTDLKKIKLFGKKFCITNKKKCVILIKGKEFPLKFMIKKKELELINNYYEIKLMEKIKITNASYMFCNCFLLYSLPDISEWDTSNIVNMSCMFANCNNLSFLSDISKWNTSNVKYMNEMFFQCFSLTSNIDISNWDISNVINMDSINEGCKKIFINDKSLLNNVEVKNLENMVEDTYFFQDYQNFDDDDDNDDDNDDDSNNDDFFSLINDSENKSIVFIEK